MICNGRQRRQAAAILFHRKYAARAFGQQSTCQPAGARPDLEDVGTGQITGLTRDLGREVQIQKEVLAQRFARR